eukprot:GEMP01132510.1.p1 GENE.GEMP01132510.1~~GEMP01132510.1.p1  ORF type:complete len:101 (-),score=1.70 GEMP01132510.1:25-327(-)
MEKCFSERFFFQSSTKGDIDNKNALIYSKQSVISPLLAICFLDIKRVKGIYIIVFPFLYIFHGDNQKTNDQSFCSRTQSFIIFLGLQMCGWNKIRESSLI